MRFDNANPKRAERGKAEHTKSQQTRHIGSESRGIGQPNVSELRCCYKTSSHCLHERRVGPRLECLRSPRGGWRGVWTGWSSWMVQSQGRLRSCRGRSCGWNVPGMTTHTPSDEFQACFSRRMGKRCKRRAMCLRGNISRRGIFFRQSHHYPGVYIRTSLGLLEKVGSEKSAHCVFYLARYTIVARGHQLL